jgi:chloramphenicol 3-O phosphotransferase
MSGKIIILNGASSSGKSTLAQAVQQLLPLPFWHYSIDHLVAARVLPSARIESGEFAWPDLRQQFFEGFHHSIAAFAAAGNNLIVEHIVETEAWMHRLLLSLEDFDVFFVGLHCPLEELERRSRQRGNHKVSEARADFEVTHTFGAYDFEFASTEAVSVIAAQLVIAWSARTPPSAFATMLRKLRSANRAA